MAATSKIHKTIREVQPDARIILGGPHVTLIHAAQLYEKTHDHEGRGTTGLDQLCEMFDVLVTRDGEESIFRALTDHPPKLVDGDDSKSELFLTNKRLTELPLPARHLLDVDSYQYENDGVRALSLIAKGLRISFPP